MSQLSTWSSRREWTQTGAVPLPEKFLNPAEKYCPPPRAPWRPSLLIGQLPELVWAQALSDVHAALGKRQILTPEREQILFAGTNDRTRFKLDRFWHDLILDTPAVRAHQLHASPGEGQ